MLALDSEEWGDLTHAYGTASDIPPLLRELETFPQKATTKAQPYLALWGSLCNQGDVYVASYAAVPHVVAILESAPARANEDFFHLPIRIEICRQNGGPEIPNRFRGSYVEALAKLPGLAAQVHARSLSEAFLRVLSATMAVSGGQTALGEAILALEPKVAKRFMKWVVTW